MGLTTAIIVLAALGTAFLSSIFGMLGGLILMGLLVSIMPIGAAMVLHGLIQLTSNGYRAWLNRADIVWPIIASLFVGNVLALAGLAFVSFSPDRTSVLLALGLLPYVAWALPKSLVLDVTRKPIGVFAGLIVVATNLLAGVGGPLLDVFFQRVSLTRHQVVADWPNFWLLGAAMAASVLGTRLGKRVLDTMQDATFFTWTQRILLSVGAVLIARALYLLSS
jgi:uncharacterized membrane protein YfcA